MLSIIVSWRDRLELNQALPSLLAAARKVGGDVNIVNYSGSSSLLLQQLGQYAEAVRVIEIPSQQYFNKAASQNIGAAHTQQPLLFFCDCDIILNPDSVAAIVGQLQSRPDTFATLAGVRESETNSRGGKHVVSFGYELRIRTADGRVLNIVDNEEDAEEGTRQAPGLLFVRRQHFLSINGYNSDLHGWGWEDQDMISRLTLGAGLTRLIEGQAIHISHDDYARTAFYPPVASRWESRDRMFRKALSNYDEANFQGSYQRDVSALGPKVWVHETIVEAVNA
ncbi:galactosyltransferase-related protein [Parachitinimonas caeni]|uniref:Galactosyltransferase-related protein n=1 Tax=Parachitinimonas caeni TaxID=3031301 RepID=A0ABT7DRY1_9NEIS|nr:galactosyltransferase-related protein [Parachitinimonas caeni]MDK2122714.1 galactosyltransferase-related protein [Parachitinimonas caeni]